MKSGKMKLCAFVLFVSVLLLSANGFTFVFAENSNDELSKMYCSATIEDAFVDNEIIIVVFPEFNDAEYEATDFSTINCIALKELSKDVGEGTLGRILKLTILEHSKQKVLDAIQMLEQREDIYSAEPNYLSAAEATDGVAVYSTGNRWANVKVSLLNAWTLTEGSTAVKVGVIDSGIDATHPYLSNQVDTNLSRCFTDSYTTGIEDATGHGTQVAGIIGAEENSQFGMQGVCQYIKLVSLRVERVFNNRAYLDTAATVEAIEYADQQGIRILNYSSGSSSYSSDAVAFELAILNYDGLFVCSTNNTHVNSDANPYYPANHRMPHLISVGASDQGDEASVFSAYGKSTVDIFAPGENLLTTQTGGSYTQTRGAYMAAPYVTGVAALMLAVNPGLEAYQLKQILMSSVDTVYDDDGNDMLGDLCVSGGRLNAYQAVYSAMHNYHSHEYYYVDEYCHSYNCEICDYSAIEESHVFNHAEHYGHYNEHSEICECGRISLGYHNYEFHVNSAISGKHHSYCRCGYSVLNNHDFVAAEAGAGYNWICQDCGKTSN